MLKSIFIQLWNRKRSNIWLFFELLLVFCLIWYMADYLFVINYNRSIPNYRDTAHTWQIRIGEYASNNPDYKDGENRPEAREANYNRILQLIRNYSGVEALGISFYENSYPGSGGYNGTSYINPADSAKEVSGQFILIDPQTDFFKVFRYSTDQGKTPVSVQDFDWTIPQGGVIGKRAAETLFSGEPAIGRELGNGYNKDKRAHILGVVDDVKRFDYLRPQNTFYFAERLHAGNLSSAIISIRVNSSISNRIFQEKFIAEMTGPLQTGNFYLNEVTSYSTIEANIETRFGLSNEIRIRTYLMVFFLLSIILCVTGTFWYRINVRREEIGLRKALGSTRTGIRNILILEGVYLLAIVLIPAMLIEYQFVHAGLIETMGSGRNSSDYHSLLPDKTLLRFLITNGITFLIMGTVTVLAIWLPATKAAKLEAVDALRDE